MTQIHRREFLRKLARSAPVAVGAAGIAATAAKAHTQIHAQAEPALSALRTGFESLQKRVHNLDERIEALEGSQRKWLRIALGAAALSLGIDVSALL